MKVTGERIVTPEGGFNASWQRHAACYALAARFLGPGRVLDLGCGLGHATRFLEPRTSIGLDLDHDSLAAQDRPTVAADLRRLPFADGSYGSVLCAHAIEHVPDPERVLAESSRVLAAGGVAVFVTPNRLTFGRPDEIIDPYHFVEYDAAQLARLCAGFYESVESYGLFGSPRYMDFHRRERVRLDALLRLDPLRLRRFVPRRSRQFLYDWQLTRARLGKHEPAAEFTIDDFELRSDGLEAALDVFAVCR